MANKRIYQLSNRAATTGRYLMIDVTGLTEAEKILLSELFVLADNDSDDIDEGSTNLFLTTTERSKLSGIANGAEVNVNADWNSVSGDSEILNKPTIPDSLDDLSGDSDDIDEGSTNLFNKLPPGGTAGQVLTKDTVTNYDASWQTPETVLDPVAAALIFG